MSSTARLTHTLVASPILTPENEAYFAAAAEGRLLIKECGDCDRVHFYPRAACPFCQSASTRWRVASGNGRLYSYTLVSAKPAPYVLAYVTLDEGVTMLTQLVEFDPARLKVDMPVGVRFVAAPDQTCVPVFAPLLQ